LFTLLPVTVAPLKERVVLSGDNMTKVKTSYCQGCIRTEVTLKLTMANGRPYWLCKKCLNPLPRESYKKNDESESRKAWGDSKYENKG